MVPPEQSADLRDYYNKHTKTDRLDSRLLARLPLLHPEGLREIDNLSPAEALRRAVRHRSAIQKPCTRALQRLDVSTRFSTLPAPCRAPARCALRRLCPGPVTGIVVSAPGVATTLAAGILGRTGDLNRFANLAGVRSFTGLVPKVDQSGLDDNPKDPKKTGDPGLRQALFLAADQAREVDPTLGERYYRLVVHQGEHRNSALCSIAPVLMSRIAACCRNGTRYELRDTDGSVITEAEGRAICAERYKVDPAERAKGRRANAAKAMKGRAGQHTKEPADAAPAPGPLTHRASPRGGCLR